LVQEGEELVSTAVGASGAPLRYAIEDGIPLLLLPELLQAANVASSAEHDPGRHDSPGHGPAGRAAETA
jgi:hypothetical protein